MKQLQILIAEDDAIIAYLLAESLKAMGHEVCAIEWSQNDAITAARLHKPDLLIVDENLGEGSGLVVVEEVLRDVRVPYVFVTGDAFKIKLRRPTATIIEKPYSEKDLALAIQEAMDFGEMFFPGDIGPNLDFENQRPLLKPFHALASSVPDLSRGPTDLSDH